MTREMLRQTFLRGAAGALAAGAFLGSGRADAEPIGSGWDGLSRAIGGQVIPPNGPQLTIRVKPSDMRRRQSAAWLPPPCVSILCGLR